MTRNQVMNLWTAVVTAFLALCTSLGLITTTAVAAVPATETARNTNAPQEAAAQEEPIWARPGASSLPPTMKQRIHAEAHGSSPSCRHRPSTEALDAFGPADATNAADAAGSNADASVTRDSAAAPAHPSGATRRTTGSIDAGSPDTGTTAVGQPAGHAADLGAELAARSAVTPATQRTRHALAAPAASAAPVAAVTLPSQSSAPVQLPAPVLAAAGTATRG
ncbi:DUF6344 domain-containing protein [Streptomyces sp. NPDC020707]|uniref:DUF6344 domain-containing protein n=1 Tax=Streptomyces sp. NPDC020707 TaxID=3365084 RepID=UPI00379F56B6